jgi:tRNA1(Val) A37 N6-methylase TrmN6
MPDHEPCLNTQEACAALGVSAATLRNWVRHGLLQVQRQGRQNTFAAATIQSLIEQLQQGKLHRLHSRANKRWRQTHTSPRPAAGHSSLTAVQATHGLSRSDLLAALTLAYLGRQAGQPMGDIPDLLAALPSNQQAEMRDWLGEQSAPCLSAAWPHLRDWPLPDGPDPLGALYASLQGEGGRARSGAFYTPEAVAARMAASVITPSLPPARILDPACGSGTFLVAAARRMQELSLPIMADTLLGYDCDPIAVRLTRLRLMLALPERSDYRPQITVAEFLALALADTVPAVDVILGNPPWGADVSAETARQVAQRWPASQGRETFAAFTMAGLSQLKPGGRLAFLLPESVLTVRVHADLRHHLVTTTTLQRLEPLGQLFAPVLTRVLWLETSKKPPATGQRLPIGGEQPHSVAQTRFAGNHSYTFDWWVTDADADLLHRLEAQPHRTLTDHADWALGIVTGSNRQHLLAAPEPGTEPIIDGTCVQPFRLGPARHHLRFTPGRYQQVAPVERYRAPEKLVYRFISRHLVVAYDDGGHLTLNSANCLIPRLPDWTAPALVALLNSTPLQALHRNRHDALKVLRSHLEALPLPLWPLATIQRLAAAARPLITGTADPGHWQALDAWIMELWGLTPTEAARLQQLVHRL